MKTNTSLLERAINDRDQALRDRWKWESELSEVKRQRDALLEALEELYNAKWLNLPGRAGDIVERAIAAVKGEKQ